jgi:surface antigen
MTQPQGASSFGERISEFARNEKDHHACGPNRVDGGGYFSSCEHHHAKEEWCADFARWVWFQAGALNTDVLTPAAGSFGIYGPVRTSGPKVGDAVLFGYNDENKTALHVAIVVEVRSDGKIVSVSGNLGANDETSVVTVDNPYNSNAGSMGGPNSPLSGYVSPVEDDLPFTREQIVDLVREGVHQELRAGVDAHGITTAQGAEAAVFAQRGLDQLAQEVTALKDLVTKALPHPPPTP